eukprot:5661340-Ditylum_brightwellii.AAC.2
MKKHMTRTASLTQNGKAMHLLQAPPTGRTSYIHSNPYGTGTQWQKSLLEVPPAIWHATQHRQQKHTPGARTFIAGSFTQIKDTQEHLILLQLIPLHCPTPSIT